MKLFSGIILLGIIPLVLPLFFSGEDQLVMTEKNHLKNKTKAAVEALAQLKSGQACSILHIGDSHIQIGSLSKGLLETFQEKKLNSRSVLYFPSSVFSDLSNDQFEVSTSGYWRGASMIDQAQQQLIGFGGRNFQLTGKSGSIQIKTKDKELISELVLFHAPMDAEIRVRNSHVETIPFSEGIDKTIIRGLKEKRKIRVKFSKKDEKALTFYGILINEGETALPYYNVGVSGSTYTDFFKSETFFRQIKALKADFIFISLGTNDSYRADLDNVLFRENLSQFYRKLKNFTSSGEIIVTTAPDTYYQQQRPKMLDFVNESIRDACQQESVLLWDWYEVMGGENSILLWKEKDLVLSDLLHFNSKGYELIGKYFGEAILAAE